MGRERLPGAEGSCPLVRKVTREGTDLPLSHGCPLRVGARDRRGEGATPTISSNGEIESGGRAEQIEKLCRRVRDAFLAKMRDNRMGR